MTDYLIFRLYGAMASWGDIAVGEVRPSYAHPPKSAVLGLIAAALGISRDEELLHRQLTESYGFAVRVDSIGTPLSDYHTVQVPPSRAGRKPINFATRRDEIAVLSKEKLNCIPSRREYRLDALATVVLWVMTSPPYPLNKLAEALQYPVYTLYLGRKSCPLALPSEAQVVPADTVRDALVRAKFAELEELHRLPTTGKPALYWEERGNSGLRPHHTFERRDVPLSRRRWQFDVRREYHALYPEED